MASSPADREIVSCRVFATPRARVWQAWAEPQHLARWWGPRGFRNTFHAFEFRPGGAWRFTMHAPDGTAFPNETVFREIVPRERIVFDHASGHLFRGTFVFEEAGHDRTRLTFRMLHDSAEDCANVRPFVVTGNEENFDRLEAELARMAAAATGGEPGSPASA